MRRNLRLVHLEDRLTPAIATWDGGGADNHWTTAANWVGDVAPQPGDDLVFPSGAAQLTNVNDFAAGAAFASLSVSDGGYQISGNAVNLSAGVSANIPSAGVSTLSVEIDGGGGLTKAGAGTLALSGANSYTGVTTVNAGFLEIQNTTALGATGAGNETVVNDGGTLAVLNPPPLLNLLTIDEAITLNGQGAPDQPSGFSGALRTLNAVVEFDGQLTLASDSQFVQFDGSTIIIGHGINEVGGAHSLHLVGARFTFTAVSVSTYTGTTFFGGTNVGTELMYLGHGVSPMIVDNNAGLEGPGTVGAVHVVNGTIGPGSSQFRGTTTTGGLDLGSGSTAIFNAFAGVDKFVVNGTVQLGGTLDFFLDPSFSFPPGTRLTLIDNDGTDGVQGTFAGLPEGTVFGSALRPVRITYHGGDGNDVQLIAVGVTTSAVGAGAGGLPVVNCYDSAGGIVRTFMAYDPAFHGGVRVVTGDVTGDSVPDVVTVPGPGGGPVVRIWDGITGAMVREFNAYDPSFRGGVFLATAILDVDTSAPDIITGAGAGGGPHVKVFDARNGSTLASFLAYDPSFFGGVSVAAFSGVRFFHGPTFRGVIVTGAGPGGGPHVKSFTSFGEPLTGFFAYDAAFRGGVNVAAHGTVLSDSPATQHIVTAPASNGGPDVRIYNLNGQQLGGFLPYAPNFFGGVSIALVATDPFGPPVIVTGAGPGGGPHVEWWALAINNTVTLQRSFFAFDPAFTGGIYVG